MNPDAMGKRLWAISLRELLIGVGLVGVACVSLKYANDWLATGLLSFAALLYLRYAIIAVIDVGVRRACAIGFILCTTAYALLFFFGGRELDPYSGAMLTTRVMLPAFQAIAQLEYVAITNGGFDMTKRFPTEAEAKAHQAASGFAGIMGGVSAIETPPRETFMTIAHVWWGALIGYCGGRYAKYVYLRRASDGKPEKSLSE